MSDLTTRESARYVDRAGVRWGEPDVSVDLPPVKLDQSMSSKKAIALLDSLLPEQIYDRLILGSNFERDLKFAHLMEKLLKVTKKEKRMSDYSMVVRCQSQIRDIIFNQTGEERFQNLKLKMKEFASQLQDLIADMVKKEEIDLDSL